MNHQEQKPGLGGIIIGGNNRMKKSPSELALEALLRPDGVTTTTNNNNNNNNNDHRSPLGGIFGFVNPMDDLPFSFKNQDTMDGFSACGGMGGGAPWYQDLAPIAQHPCVSGTIDSQSSICAGSPTSILKPKSGDNQGSGSGSSEDDDAEIEAGPCEESNDPSDIKRIRRMDSNRESARRSRKRRQAHLQELEMQVEQLNGENVTLYKQLTEATQQLRDATTNNRVLKSDVEALRAKVKLAEDMVTRGSLSCSLNQLIQSQLGSAQNILNSHGLARVPSMVAPTVTVVRGQDGPFGGSGLAPSVGSESVGHVLSNGSNDRSVISNGLVSDAVSCAWR